MIKTDPYQDDDFEIVDGNFTIDTDANDQNIFLNLNTNKKDSNAFVFEKGNTTDLSYANPFFGQNARKGTRNERSAIVTPNVQQPKTCTGNCDSCIFGFMCQSLKKNFTSLSGGVLPKLS